MASRALDMSPAIDADLPALPVEPSAWQRWLASGVSLALLVAIAVRLWDFGLTEALTVLPRTPVFWLTFAAYYLALPVSEWIIFRRLWNLPVSGIVTLVRKLVSNEILMGYSGEVYFYSWARRHTNLTTAPFGAIKDVSILSALAGNAITLAMCALVWPVLGKFTPMAHGQTIILSAGVVMGISLLILFFRNRLFSHDGPQLRRIFGIHMTRLVVMTILSGMLWHFALPDIPQIWLLFLATLQLLVTRLPFVPSKDLVFANLAVLLVGHDGVVPMAIMMISTAIVATHLVLGSLLLLPELLGRKAK